MQGEVQYRGQNYNPGYMQMITAPFKLDLQHYRHHQQVQLQGHVFSSGEKFDAFFK